MLALLTFAGFGGLRGSAATLSSSSVRPYTTHPPLRAAPEPSTRPLPEGPSYWVDPVRGSNRGQGSYEEPFRTVQHALGRLEAGDTLVLRGGIYWERLIVGLTGTQSQPVTIRSHPGELAVIDGGVQEFYESPVESWEPVQGGAPDEFRSSAPHPNLTEAQGWFADSMVPLQTYQKLEDLRAEGEIWLARDAPRYCGPGLWYDARTSRLHVRLAHTNLEALPDRRRYRGETDPRKLKLVVGGGKAVPLWIEGARHLRFQDLVIRGAGSTAIRALGATDIEFEGVTAYSGRHAFYMDRSTSIRIRRSAFRGTAAPWTFRTSQKVRGVPSILFLTGASWRKSQDLLVEWSEFTDGHDGVFLGEVDQVEFRHNLVENFNDDGIFLTSRTTGPSGIRIHNNRIARCLTCFAFGWGRGDFNRAGSGVSIYRNVIELLEPIHYTPTMLDKPPVLDYFGRVASDHGGPVWEPLRIYHNTFIGRKIHRTGWGMGWGGHLKSTLR